MTKSHLCSMTTATSRTGQIAGPARGRRGRDQPTRFEPPLQAAGPDAWEVVEFAEMWSPFGGPPADEIFVRFGMSPERFSRVLAASADQIGAQLRPGR